MASTEPARLRPAAAPDAEALAAVHVAAWRETYGGLLSPAYLAGMSVRRRAAFWTEHLERPARIASVFLAEDAEGVCGFASCGPQREDDRLWDGEVYTLYLLRRAQGRGLGRALMAAMGAAMLDWGARSADVWVLEGNARAERFYARLGGRQDGRRSFRLGPQRVRERAYAWPDLAAAPFLRAAR